MSSQLANILTDFKPSENNPLDGQNVSQLATLDHLSISQKNLPCGAPYFAFLESGTRSTYRIQRGCCNRWHCPRCQRTVAELHYGRIVHGAEQLVASENVTLYFLTITSAGKENSIEYYLDNYLTFTNRFLNSAKYQHRKVGEFDWNYCQVTELQKRGAPHSHILTTFAPFDMKQGTRIRNGKKEACMRSEWLQKALVKSGLGEQYDISTVRSEKACSRYVAKYMFKASMFAVYPEKWKRVRYSQKWPKLPEFSTDAIPLVKDYDWQFLQETAQIVKPDSDSVAKTYEMLYWSGVMIDTPIQKFDKTMQIVVS